MPRTLTLSLSCIALTCISTLVSGCGANKCSGCGGDGRECGSTAACKSFKGTPTTVNKMCVIMNEDPVDPSVKPVLWRGREYGLCCEGCRPKWEKLSEAQKGAAVARVVAVAH